MTRRGYTLLMMMLLVAAATLFMLATLDLAASQRLSEGSVRNEAQARANAEAGLARTYGYLSQVLAVDGDFDRALDPNLDDDCTMPGAFTHTAEDHLPPFPDGIVVDAGGGQSFIEVAQGGGAYLVRIDDDDDDQGAMGSTLTKGDHPGLGTCREGLGVEDPVRDTNQTVVVTVIGVYPGTDLTQPQTTQTLRVTLGPAWGPGLIASGDVTLGGSAQVTGVYDNVDVLGNASIASVTNQAVVATTGSCSAGGAVPPTCEPNWVLPPAPTVDAWDIQNTPLAQAPLGPLGQDFYYVRYDAVEKAARVFLWNYASCPNPRAFSRICYPDFNAVGSPANDQLLQLDGGMVQLDGGTGRCASCWGILYAGPTDGGAGYNQAYAPFPTLVFTATTTGSNPSCAAGDPDPGTTPLGTQWPNTRRPGSTFTTVGTPPPGVWFLEGNLVASANWGGCSPASLDVLGDIQVTSGTLSLAPGALRGYTLLAGRDLAVSSGASIADCGFSAAHLIHEQLGLNGNAQVNGEVVIANRATCDPTVSVGASGAVNAAGSMSLVNNHPGPVPLGPALGELTWAGSSL